MKPNQKVQLLSTLTALCLSTGAAIAQTTPPPVTVPPAEGAAAKTPSATATTGAVPRALPSITATPGSPEEIAQLRSLVEALTTRLQTLEGAQKKTDEAVAKNVSSVSSSSKLPITVSGLLQVHGTATLGQEGPDTDISDTFRIRRGELKVGAKITPRISASAMFDIAKTQDSSDRPGDEVLQEIILTYLLNQNKESGNSHFVDVGQFKVPIGYEGDQVSSSALQTVERALMFGSRDPFRGGYGDKRETGVRLRGNIGQFEYHLGAFNGLGERQNTTATSDAKVIVGRLAYRARSVPGLLVGVSAARGNTGNSASGDPRLDRDVLNAFAAYKRNKITAQAEYLRGDAATIDGGSVRDVRSYYGSLGYMFTDKLEGVVRYDVFDFLRDASGGDVSEATLGLNYYIKGNNAKIQANIVKRDGDVLAPSGFRNDNTQFRTNFQVAF